MAEFRISQDLDVGVSGRSRVDLAPGTVITLEVTEPVDPGVTYTWRIIDAVNSVAALTSTTAATTAIGSSGAQIVELCGFLIELEANDGGVITTARRLACVPHTATGIRTPLFGESAPRTQTLALNDPDLSTDNALYANLGGRGVSGQNPFGWREWAWRVVKAIAEVQESGASASDVTDLDDRVIVLEEVGAPQESIGGTGSLWFGDSGDSDEISGRDLNAVTTARYGADRNKSYQFYFAGGQGFSQNAAALRETGDLTVEVVLQGGPANAVQWVVSHDTSPARRYYLGFDATGQIVWGFDNGATAFQIAGYPRNPWERTHIVARRTIVGPDTYLSLWVNGRVNLEDFIASQVPTGGGANNTLYFGQNSANAGRLGSAASPVLVSQLYIDPGVVWTNTQVTGRARALGIYLP